MPTRYFAGNSLAAFKRTTSTIVENATAGRFNATYVSQCFTVPADAAIYAESTTFSATGIIYYRLDHFFVGTATSGVGPALYNLTTGVVRIIQSSASTYQVQYWNGSAWTNTGSTFTLTSGVLNTVQIKVDLTVGAFELWVAGTSVASGSGWTGYGTTVTNVRLYTTNLSGSPSGSFYSQVMVADYDLRDSHLMTVALNGDSASNTAGAGAYTTIQETTLDESTAVIHSAAGKRGQTHATYTLPSGLVIASVVLNARGRVSGGVVTDGKLGLRQGGVNYSSAALALTAGYEPRTAFWDTNPAGGAWSAATLNTAETYVEAI